MWVGPPTKQQDALAGIDLQKEGVDTTVGQAVPVVDFSDFYRTNYTKLRRGLVFFFRRNPDMAEDIAQQSFVTVLAILETLIVNGFRPTSSPMMAATRRPSTSYVLASLRLHVDLDLAGGKDPTLSG